MDKGWLDIFKYIVLELFNSTLRICKRDGWEYNIVYNVKLHLISIIFFISYLKIGESD